MAKRYVARVEYLAAKHVWVVVTGHGRERFVTQKSAISYAVDLCRQTWHDDGRPAQLVLHGKNGRIRWERTYGHDPRRFKG